MNKRLYKVYDPDGVALTFISIGELRNTFDLTADDISACFHPGVHETKNGIKIITF